MSDPASLLVPYAAATVLVLGTLVAAAPLLWLRPEAASVLRYARAAAGLILVGAAAVSLVPDALERAPAWAVGAGVALGAALFIAVWKLGHAPARGDDGIVVPVLLASALHKAIDGLLLGVAHAAGPETGLTTAIALALHEVPHEMGTFALLVAAGATRARAVGWKLVASLPVYPAVAIGLGAGAVEPLLAGLLLAASAGGFFAVGLRALRGAAPRSAPSVR